MGDIIQYLTLPEVSDITGEPELTYKTFFLKGTDKNKKIEFNPETKTEYNKKSYLDASYKVKGEEEQKGMEISKVNPTMFRELKYMVTVSPDVLNPKSDDLERAYSLEEFDRMVAAPPGMFDPEETAKLLLTANPKTKRDPDKYLAKQPTPGQMQPPTGPDGQSMQPGQMPNAGNSPLNAAKKISPMQPNKALAGIK